MADFFELQDRARAKTRNLVLYFIVAVILIVIAVNLAVWFSANLGGLIEIPIKQWPLHIYSWITTAVVIGLIFITSAIQSARLSGGGDAVAKMVNARRVLPGTKDKHERRLLNITEEMSIASGMPMPKVFVMDDESAINAFVAGLKPSQTVLVVTYGTLKKLSRDELQGVIGHEFSHIFNADMNINVRLIGIVAGILVIGQLGYGLMRILGRSRYGVGLSSRGSSKSSNSSGNILLVIAVLGGTLFAIGYIGLFFGRLIKASISRQREYLADASSVQFTRDADGIANALAHIQIDSSQGRLHNKHAEDMSHMCFEMPVSMSFKGWLATHPPLEQRIKAINPNFSMKDYRPKSKISDDFEDNSQQSSAYSQAEHIAGFAAASIAGSRPSKTTVVAPQQSQQTTQSSFIQTIGKPTPDNLLAASAILNQIPAAILEQSQDDSIKAQLVVYALLVHAESEDKQQIDQFLQTQLPEDYFKIFIQWQNQLLGLSGWIRLPLLNHVIPTLQQCSRQEIQLFFATVLTIIKNNKLVNLSEYILYALLKARLQAPEPANIIPSLVEVKPELSLIFSLLVNVAYSDPISAKENYQSIMKSFAIGIIPTYSEQTFDAVKTHSALLRLTRLSPFLKRTIVTAMGDCVTHDGQVSLDEYELLRAICDYFDCPLPAAISI